MIPFCLLTVAWIVAASSELIQRPLFRDVAAHLLFPLGFVILALLKIAHGFYNLADAIRLTGDASTALYLDGMVSARALAVMVAAAILSLFTTTLVWLVRARGSSFGVFQPLASVFGNVEGDSSP